MLYHSQNRLNKNCGQIAVAAITGKSVADIERIVRHGNCTTTRELAHALHTLGYRCPNRCIVAKRFKQLPEFALGQVRQEGQKNNWHWVAIGEGKVWDGLEDGPVEQASYTGRITSYLPIRFPAPGTDLARHIVNGVTCKTTKRYPRVTAGPLRGQYVHRVVAAALIGRDLTSDEEVHHKDADRRNFHWSNLMILGQKDHGWVSAKQAYYMRA